MDSSTGVDMLETFIFYWVEDSYSLQIVGYKKYSLIVRKRISESMHFFYSSDSVIFLVTFCCYE